VPNKLVANDDLVEGENGFYYITNEAAHVNYVCKINRENESLVPLGLPCCAALFAIVCCYKKNIVYRLAIKIKCRAQIGVK
jgi:hypothetical protein